MASKKPTQPPPLQPKVFESAEEIDRAIARLRRRHEDFDALLREHVRYDDQLVDNAENKFSNSVLEIYGEHSPEFRNSGYFHFITAWSMDPDPAELQRDFVSGVQKGKLLIEGLISELDERRLDLPSAPAARRPSTEDGQRRVFLVHGHDDALKHEVARFVEQIHGDVPVILHEQHDGGRTVIEKLEANSEHAAFVVVLMTPDDEGCKKGEVPRPRARQNVVFELGYFVGLLGRKNVVVLLNEKVENLSDIAGVLYTPIDTGGGWKLKLAREMKAAGVPVDASKLI